MSRDPFAASFAEKLACVFAGHDIDYSEIKSEGDRLKQHCSRCYKDVASKRSYQHRNFAVQEERTGRIIQFDKLDGKPKEIELDLAFNFDPYLYFKKIGDLDCASFRRCESVHLSEGFEMPDPEEVGYLEEKGLYHMYIKLPVKYVGAVAEKKYEKTSDSEGLEPKISLQKGMNFAILELGVTRFLHEISKFCKLKFKCFDSSENEKNIKNCKTMAWGTFCYDPGALIDWYVEKNEFWRLEELLFIPKGSSTLKLSIDVRMDPMVKGSFKESLRKYLTNGEKLRLGIELTRDENLDFKTYGE